MTIWRLPTVKPGSEWPPFPYTSSMPARWIHDHLSVPIYLEYTHLWSFWPTTFHQPFPLNLPLRCPCLPTLVFLPLSSSPSPSTLNFPLPSTITNKSYSSKAESYDTKPWQKKIAAQIASALDSHTSWLDAKWVSEANNECRLLDYACGTGSVTRVTSLPSPLNRRELQSRQSYTAR
jgi:hypothetical protein